MRCFFALPVPESAREDIARVVARGKQLYPHLKWVPPENVHITLHFLGEIADRQVELFRNQLRDAPFSTGRFRLEYRGIGQFPPGGAARVLFLHIEAGETECGDIYRTLTDSLDPHIDLQQRPYTPHLTLARSKKHRKERIDLSTFDDPCGSFFIDRVCLYESVLTPGGAKYRELAEKKLH